MRSNLLEIRLYLLSQQPRATGHPNNPGSAQSCFPYGVWHIGIFQCPMQTHIDTHTNTHTLNRHNTVPHANHLPPSCPADGKDHVPWAVEGRWLSGRPLIGCQTGPPGCLPCHPSPAFIYSTVTYQGKYCNHLVFERHPHLQTEIDNTKPISTASSCLV